MSAPDASVLIPSYDNRDGLLLCLAHLARQTCPPERFEVVVVLDGSTDGSAEALAGLDTPLALTVLTQPNRGRAAALNRAAGAARGALLIVIDDDILTNPEFIARHLAAHADADVILGSIPLAEQSPVSFLTDGVREWAEDHDRRMRRRRGPSVCSEIYGANLSIARADFERIGGYREDLRRTEDFQLGKKILAAGLSVAYCPEAVAAQLYDKTFSEWCADFYRDGRSHTGLVREFPEEAANLRIGRYFPISATKRVLRPLLIRGGILGTALLAPCKLGLELARRLGLRWRILRECQGVIGDALFWKGAYDEFHDPAAFRAFIAQSRHRAR